jgi:hypothetical protein
MSVLVQRVAKQNVLHSNFKFLKPFFCIRFPVRTSGPATRLPFSVLQIFQHPFNMFYSRFTFFYDGNPADPFIALNRREVIPFHHIVGIGCQCFLHITRHLMQNTIGNFNCHSLFLASSNIANSK